MINLSHWQNKMWSQARSVYLNTMLLKLSYYSNLIHVGGMGTFSENMRLTCELMRTLQSGRSSTEETGMAVIVESC